MRIAFLFDNSNGASTALDRVTYAWITGLAESQHEIKVITNHDHLPPESLSSPRVTWARAMNTWSFLELPRLARALLPYSPEVVHVVLCRQMQWGQFSAMGAAFQAFRLPLVVSTGEGRQTATPHWPGVLAWLNPGKPRISPPPILSSGGPAAADPKPGTVYIPGPLHALRNWRRTLREVFALAARPSQTVWHLGFDWSEIALPERLQWRQMAASLPSGKVLTLGTLPLEGQILAARGCEHVRLKELDSTGWTHAVLAQALARTGANPTDAAINGLTRAYLEAARGRVARGSTGMA